MKKTFTKKQIMKTIFGMILFVGLTAGVFNCAEAQRSRDNGGRGNRESNASSRESRSNSSEGRTFPQNTISRNNSFTPSQRSTRSFTPNRIETNRTFPQRNAITRNDVRVERNVNASRQNNVVLSSAYNRNRITTTSRANSYYPNRTNNYRYNTGGYRYNNYYRYNSNYYGGGYYSYNNRRYSFMYGPRYNYRPRSFISINFGGSPYYYNSGFFYGYYGGYYQPIFPPFGLHIGVLPYGYNSFYWGGDPYYYYNGIYYRQYNNYYEVVDAPIGATVYNLPEGAKAVVLNGEKLYELNGTYYKEDRDSKGQTIYTVVGKNGEVNNTDESGDLNSTDNNLNNGNINNDNDVNTAPSSSSLQVGDIVSQLPEGSKVVTIKGEKMYVTPDDTYLKEKSDGGTIEYEVVGK